MIYEQDRKNDHLSHSVRLWICILIHLIIFSREWNHSQQLSSIQEEYGRTCNLTITDPQTTLIHPMIESSSVRMITKDTISEDTVLLCCVPLLRYFSGPLEGRNRLTCALRFLSDPERQELIKHSSNLYPRSNEDIIRLMKMYHPRADNSNILELRCCINEFRLESKSLRLLYLEASGINHSCSPNCSWTINSKFRLSITSKRELKPGEEITIDYIPIIESELGNSRRNKLMKRGFYCHCERYLNRCHTCDVLSASRMNVCSKCRIIPYCSRECQSKDWKEHKNLCPKIL